MKKIILIFALFLNFLAFSQDKELVVPTIEAQYVGGAEAMTKFISTNVKYPKNSKLEGKVYVEFVVNEQGGIQDVKVLRGLDKEFDDISVNLIKKMPNWIPASDEKGNPISSKMILPINFKR
jgi:periplasmic protein TonB